jgi:hypothetical protein
MDLSSSASSSSLSSFVLDGKTEDEDETEAGASQQDLR